LGRHFPPPLRSPARPSDAERRGRGRGRREGSMPIRGSGRRRGRKGQDVHPTFLPRLLTQLLFAFRRQRRRHAPRHRRERRPPRRLAVAPLGATSDGLQRLRMVAAVVIRELFSPFPSSRRVLRVFPLLLSHEDLLSTMQAAAHKRGKIQTTILVITIGRTPFVLPHVPSLHPCFYSHLLLTVSMS